MLHERGADAVLPELGAWLERTDPNGLGSRQLEALWLHQAFGKVEPELLASLLESPDYRVRAAAVPVVGDWADQLDAPLSLLGPRVVDEHPRVRLETVRALARFPDPHAAELALRALDQPRDRFLDYALWLTARELAPSWVPALQAGTVDFDKNPDHLLFALEAAGSSEVVGTLLKTLAARDVPADQAADLMRLIGTLGRPDDLARAVDVALDDERTAEERARWLTALVDGSEARNVQPTGDLGPRLGQVLDDATQVAEQVAAARALGAGSSDRSGPG